MANSKAIEAGGAFVRLFTDKSPMVRGLRDARQEFDSWAAGIGSAGAKLLGAGAAGFAGGSIAVKQFADMGSALNDMSVRTGVSVEELSGLKYAAEQNGSSLEALEGGLKKYSKTAVAATQGNKEALDAFNTLGISITELNGMSAEDQLELIGNQLNKLPEGARRSAAAMGIFGKSGSDLIPVLTDLRANMDRAKELGLGWTTDEAANADALGDRLDDLKSVALRTVQVVGGELAPAVMAITKPLLKAAVATREWAAENPGVIQTVALATAGLGALGVTLVTVGAGLSLAGVAAGGFATAWTGVGAAIGVTAAPMSALNSATSLLSGTANAALKSYGALSSGITSVVTAGAGQVTKLAGAGANVGAKAASKISAGAAYVADAVPSIPLSRKTDVSAGKAYIANDAMDTGDTYSLAGSKPTPTPKAGALDKLLKSRAVKPYAKAGKDLKKSADLFTQVIASPFNSQRTANAFGKLGPAIGKATTQAFAGNYSKAGQTAGKAGQRLATSLWQGFDTKRNSGKLSNAGGALASGIGKLGKAGIGTGVAVMKTSLGGLQAVVSPLIGSFGALTGGIRTGFNSAGNSVLKFGVSMAASLAPLLAIGAIAGIGYLIATETDIGRSAIVGLQDTASIAMSSIGIAGGEMADRMSEAWTVISTEAVAGGNEMVTAYGGVVDAVAAGDLGLAGEVALAGLESAWRTGAATIIDTWDVATSAILSTWTDTVAGAQAIGENLTAWFSTTWLDIKGFAFDAFNAIMNKWDSASGWIADKLIDISVATGVVEGDAEEIKKTRGEDTKARQKGRDGDVKAEADKRIKQKAEIEQNRVDGQKGIESERVKEQQRISDERDKALLENEQKKIAAQEKLKSLREKAAVAKDDAVKAAADETAKKDKADKDEEDAALGNTGSSGGPGAQATVSGIVSSLNRGGAVSSPEDTKRMAIDETTAALGQQKLAYDDVTKAAQMAADVGAAVLSAPVMESLKSLMATIRIPDISAISSPSTARTESTFNAQAIDLEPLLHELRKLNSTVEHGGTLTA